jgi:ankyrin repeat protein
VRDFLLARLAAHGVALDVFEAAATGDQTPLRSLLATEPDLAQAFSGDGWTALHLAAAFGPPAAVAALLAAGSSVATFSQNPQKNQPLHAALALGKNAETVRLLLKHGAPVNAAQAGGFTPIFSAAIANRVTWWRCCLRMAPIRIARATPARRQPTLPASAATRNWPHGLRRSPQNKRKPRSADPSNSTNN